MAGQIAEMTAGRRSVAPVYEGQIAVIGSMQQAVAGVVAAAHHSENVGNITMDLTASKIDTPRRCLRRGCRALFRASSPKGDARSGLRIPGAGRQARTTKRARLRTPLGVKALRSLFGRDKQALADTGCVRKIGPSSPHSSSPRQRFIDRKRQCNPAKRLGRGSGTPERYRQLLKSAAAREPPCGRRERRRRKW